MTKKTRTLLFFILLFCFLVIAPSIVFYSWGYRFNFETKKIVKTGAFYFKVLPKSAQIYLTPFDAKGLPAPETKLLKRTDFFFGAILIENLLPKRYEIEIKKDGFYPWKKILEIKENQVTEAKNIVLVPQDIGINPLTKNVEDFFPSPDEKIIILKEMSGSSNTSATASLQDWALKIFDLDTGVKSHLMESKDISKNGEVLLLDLRFSPDSQRILLKAMAKQQLKYYLLDLSQIPSKLILLDFLDEESKDISFNPANTQELIVFEKGNIYKADFSQKKISAKILENVRSFQISNQDFYYLDASGFLFKADSSFSKQEKINNLPFPLEKNKDYQINILSPAIFLSDGQKLFLFNPDSSAFEDFFETSNTPKISPDLKKAVYYSNYEIWILFLKPELGQPQKESKEQLFIARFSEKMGEIFFFTNHYLIFNNGRKIKIAETDDRDIINIVDLAEFESPKIFWNQKYKKLFILSNGSFYSSKVLIP